MHSLTAARQTDLDLPPYIRPAVAAVHGTRGLAQCFVRVRMRLSGRSYRLVARFLILSVSAVAAVPAATAACTMQAGHSKHKCECAHHTHDTDPAGPHSGDHEKSSLPCHDTAAKTSAVAPAQQGSDCCTVTSHSRDLRDHAAVVLSQTALAFAPAVLLSHGPPSDAHSARAAVPSEIRVTHSGPLFILHASLLR